MLEARRVHGSVVPRPGAHPGRRRVAGHPHRGPTELARHITRSPIFSTLRPSTRQSRPASLYGAYNGPVKYRCRTPRPPPRSQRSAAQHPRRSSGRAHLPPFPLFAFPFSVFFFVNPAPCIYAPPATPRIPPSRGSGSTRHVNPAPSPFLMVWRAARSPSLRRRRSRTSPRRRLRPNRSPDSGRAGRDAFPRIGENGVRSFRTGR